MATKVAIIAGFEPFADFDNNPSGEAVAHIERYCQGFDATSLVLPVCCGSGWDKLQQAVAKLPKDARFALVMAGLAGTRKVIEIERFALNCKDYRIPDNENHQWTGEEIVPGAPAAIRSPIVDQDLLATLSENGFQCAISNHAGTFVCNELYYRALHDWRADERCAGIVFTHVPPLAAYTDEKTPPARRRSRGAPQRQRKLRYATTRYAAPKKGMQLSSQDKEDGYPIYRYAEALALIARYLLK